MASKTLVASGNTGLTGMTISGSYPITNAYTDSSDTSTYARYSINTSTTGYVYLTYDTSDIPPTATIQSVTAKARLRISNTSRVTNRVCQLYTGTTAKGSNTDFSSTTSGGALTTLSTGTSWTRSELNDLRMRIGGTGSSSTSSKYIYIYGTDITITYVTASRTVTTTLTGSGTIDPSGTQTMYDGDEYELTITPTNKADTVTATKNGTDITSQLVAHGTESTITAVPGSATTSSIQNGSSYAQYAVGHSAESPYSSTSNMYAASGSTGYAAYSFDFSDIPSNAIIENIEVRCHGHRESATISSTYVSKCGIYNGSTLISEYVEFPSTSASIITLEPNTTVTRAQLDKLAIRHYVGYYGGLVTSISFEVTYSAGTEIDHYTYSTTIDSDMTVAVVIGGSSQPKIFIKNNGTWTQYSKVYKKVNGSWVEQASSTWATLFNTSTNYRKME